MGYHFKFLFLFFFSFLYNSSCAQNIFSIGFRDDLGLINYKIGNIKRSDFMVYPIQNIYFTFDIEVNKANSFQIRPGYILAKNDFNGWEIGGYWIYNFAEGKYYSSFGFNLHLNNDVNGGNSGGYGNVISLLGFGIGYRTSEILALEISYQHPLKKHYGWFHYKGDFLQHSVESIIKLGVFFTITRH